MKIKSLVFALSAMIALSACGGNPSTVDSVNPSTPASSENVSVEESVPASVKESVDHTGETGDPFVIDDVFVFFENDETEFLIQGVEEEYYDDIAYSYDDEYMNYIDIYGNTIASVDNSSKPLDIKVSASFKTLKTRFTVHYRNDANSGNEGFNQLAGRRNHINSKMNEQTTTLFVGDSFFDNGQFWTKFYTEVEKGVIAGISASTLESWFYYVNDLVIKNEPEALVMHLGTNDFWDLHHTPDEVFSTWVLMMNYIHNRLPDTTIYYITIENRSYVMQGTSSQLTIEYLNDFNDAVMEYAESVDYIKVIDSFTYFTNDNGSCNAGMFKDGTHPKNEHYRFFVEEAIKLGCDITYIEPEPVEPAKENEYVFTSDHMWGNDEIIKKDGANLANKFVASGTVKITETSNNNNHFGFQFSSDCTFRFLLWNSNGDASTFYVCGAFGAYHNTSANAFSYARGTNETFNWKVVASERNAYFFVNDKLNVVFLNLNPNSDFRISAENMGVRITVDAIARANDGTNSYENEIAKLSTYETDSRTSATYIEVNA